MSTCIDSGFYWLNKDTLYFKSIYHSTRGMTYPEIDTCPCDKIPLYHSNGYIYRFVYSTTELNLPFPFIRTDIIQQERKQDSIRRAGSGNHLRIRAVPHQPDTSTNNKK